MLKNKKYKTVECLVEEIDGEKILYDEETRKIMVLNVSAAFIWNVLSENSDKECTLSTEELFEKIAEHFDTTNIECERIKKDIENILNGFIENKFLIVY